MEDIKINIIKKGWQFTKSTRFLKLSNNNYFLSKDEGSLILLNSNLKIIYRCGFGSFGPIAYEELYNKDIIAVGRNLIKIYKIQNKQFSLIQQIFDSTLAELVHIIVLSNGKIIISSIMNFLIILEKRQGVYTITRKINVSRLHDIEYISDNKILLLDTYCHYNNLTQILDKTEISILDFSEEKIKKKTIKNIYKIDLIRMNKNIFNLNNGYYIFVSEKFLYIFDLKKEEIISLYEMEDRLIDLFHYKNELYLGSFGKTNKVALISLKEELLIKETKYFKSPQQFIQSNNKIYLVCLDK